MATQDIALVEAHDGHGSVWSRFNVGVVVEVEPPPNEPLGRFFVQFGLVPWFTPSFEQRSIAIQDPFHLPLAMDFLVFGVFIKPNEGCDFRGCSTKFVSGGKHPMCVA